MSETLFGTFTTKDMKVEVVGNSVVDVSTILPFDETYPYYEALETNNAEKVALILSPATTQKRKALLDGQFDFGEESTIPQTHLSRLSRPLFVATMMGAMEVVELLIKQGADVHQENCHGENIVHTLVAASALDNISEDEAVKFYQSLVTVVGKSDIHKLLFYENRDGLRPMEMAANLGCITLYEAIHLTPDVFVTKIIDKGSFKEEWIDITEYETYEAGNRRNLSPVVILSFLEKQIAFGKTPEDILKCQTINMWMDMKHKSIRVPSCLWILLSISCLFCYTIFMTNGMDLVSEPEDKMSSNSNNTQTASSYSKNSYLYFKLPFTPSLILVVFMITYHILLALLELFGYAMQDKKGEKLLLRSLSAEKEMVVSHIFYLNFDLFTNIAIPLSLILTLINQPELKFLSIFWLL